MTMDIEAILTSLSETGNLSKTCRDLDQSRGYFLQLCGEDAALADRYARAREAGLDAEADRAIDEAIGAQDAGLGRLALDARKWYLSKLLPKKYGDKLDVTSGGERINWSEKADAARRLANGD